MKKSICPKKIGKAAVLVIIILGVLSGIGSASEKLEGNLARVIGKAPNCVVITDHNFKLHSNNVILNSVSSIYDIDRNKISLKQLKVPCIADANVYQSNRTPDPELIELRVKEYAQHASPNYTMKRFKRMPE